jgi:hypothetical protein
MSRNWVPALACARVLVAKLPGPSLDRCLSGDRPSCGHASTACLLWSPRARARAYWSRNSSRADTGLRASTITRRLAAIAYAHKLKGLESPTAAEAVHVVMRGIRRKISTAAAGKAPDFGPLGRAYVETELDAVDRESVIRDFTSGQNRMPSGWFLSTPPRAGRADVCCNPTIACESLEGSLGNSPTRITCGCSALADPPVTMPHPSERS